MVSGEGVLDVMLLVAREKINMNEITVIGWCLCFTGGYAIARIDLVVGTCLFIVGLCLTSLGRKKRN